ncbi:MAG: DUF885 domain-containing protein [Gammaproteobacteria bacterium]|nr:DUF885 domain-containing protein [Gammaproteobacteria bacterium]
MKAVVIVAALMLLSACQTTSGVKAVKSSADHAFEAVMAAQWASTLKQNPTFATNLGVRDYDDRLSDPSLEAYDASVEEARGFLAQLNAIDTAALSAENKLNHQLLSLGLRNEIEAAQYGGKYLIMNNRSGPHLNMTGMPDRLPFFNEANYQSYVQRLAAVPQYMQRATARIAAGLDAGWVQPCAPMQGFEQSVNVHLVENVNDSAFMKPFASKPAVMNQASFDELKNQAAAIVEQDILPSFRKFGEFYKLKYAPRCREKVGTDSMPGGKEYYDYRVRYYTTTDRSADEIHQIGLSEVARIRAEMDEVIKEAGFDGSFEEWLVYLRDTPEFYPKTPAERMQVAANIAKKMDGEMPKLFGKLPRMPYGLKEIPLDIAEKTTTAYYQPPAGDGSRAGFYYVNTTLLDTRPNYQMEALGLHEAVPGHHLQIALAYELDLPPFRRFGGQTVFVEGWGLYSERLGLEVGFYQTPYTNFGRLSYEMWRACRLVVDTGLHSKGWTRQQAIDYMAANSGLSMNNITSEVDRYISWPGQALAYKTGELKIRELRAKAESRLGENFDIRAFHDKVLENGAVPLSVLEQIVTAWIEAQAQR